MIKNLSKVLIIMALPLFSLAQNNETANNGQIDNINEFATIMTVPFTMPDGIKLYTDIYLPVLSDCLSYFISIDTNIANQDVLDSFTVELITKGTQIIIYDSITPPDTLSTDPLKLKWNDYDSDSLIPNPNPYQLPVVFTRTPYDKTGEDAMALMTLLGYVGVMQDMRGRYTSEGVYMPMYSDSWSKDPYHPNWGHVLDRQTPINDPPEPGKAASKHGNHHEDGYNSIRYMTGAYQFDSSMSWLKDEPSIYDIDLDGVMDTTYGINRLTRVYDYNRDGIPDTFAIPTPCIGTFGASALGNTQYQAAAAHKINTSMAGLKCLLPIVATNEHFKYTGYQNGVFRDRIVTGWVKGQIFTGVDDDSVNVINYFKDLDVALGNPGGVHNSMHTSWDYGNNNKFDAATEAIDHFTMFRPTDNDVAGYYPNAIGRADMDASRAMVDEKGEGDVNGTHSRYENMDVPAYHLFGWWDIFVDGQIETNNLMRKYSSPENRKLQKVVIGPWAHQTIGSTETGDQTYPNNVLEALGLDLSETDGDTLPLTDIFGSDIVSWYRHNLSYTKGLGEPKIFIPESQTLQPGSGCPDGVETLRIPAEDYIILFEDFINFLSGYSALPPIKVEVTICGGVPSLIELDIPANPNSLLPGLANTEIKPPKDKDFFDPEISPPYRFYVVGDGLDNTVGNYWFEYDTFPLVDSIAWTKKYLHQNGALNETPPATDEGFSIYVHDPDDPVLTTGGANMIVRTPQDDKNSQGQMNLADPLYAPYSMDRQGVISFEGDPIQDSLCIIGHPVATLYAKSSPGGETSGPTDTDFFVRILDVFPDGKELFVVEGCVNARARDYAKALVHGADGTRDFVSKGFPLDEPKDGIQDIPFTNINIGEVYEYKFKMMPIAYTWGAGHKIKILISSSNYTRYQVNPNLPIEPGAFFRRKPGDGQKYTFQNVEMSPRVAVQRIAISPQYPSNIDLPVYTQGIVQKTKGPIPNEISLNALVYPNPAKENVSVFMSQTGRYVLNMVNIMGQLVQSVSFTSEYSIDLRTMDTGLYLLQIEDQNTGKQVVKKLSVK